MLLLFQKMCDHQCIFLCPVHTDSKRLDPSEDQPAVHRCKGCPCRLDDKTKLFLNVLAVCYQKTCKCVIMSTQIFCPAMHNNVSTKLQRILEIW